MLTLVPSRSVRQVLVASLALVVVTIVATWPLATDPAHLSVVRPTDNDFRLNNYFIAWGAHAVTTDPLSLHHTNMFHPERYTFVYADMLLAQSLLMLPIIKGFDNPVLTYNLLLIIGFVIGGTGFFVLSRRLTGRAGAAFVGSLMWVFNPVHFTRYQQIQLVGDHWLPWMVWALYRWLEPEPGDDARPGGWAALAAGFFCLNALSGSHLAVFGALTALIVIGWLTLRDRRWNDAEVRRGLAVFALLAGFILAPIFWPYLLVEEQMTATRAVTLDLPNASLRPLEGFSARTRLYSWVDDAIGWPSALLNPRGRELRAYGFPGLLPLIFAALGVVLGRRYRRVSAPWVFALGLFVFLAMGSYGGYLLLGDVPLFRLIRVPTRFLLPAVFALGLLAAVGLAELAHRLRRARGAAVALALIGLVFAAEATYAPLRTWEYPHEPRLLNEFLAAQPGDFAIVEFPVDPFATTINMRQVANSAYHWKRLLVGYSGYQSAENIDLLRRVRDTFPSDRCLDELAGLDVRYVIVLRDRVDADLLAAVQAQVRLSPAWEREGWLVYRVLETDAERQ